MTLTGEENGTRSVLAGTDLDLRSSDMYERLSCTIDEAGIARLRLNRPDAANTLDLPMAQELEKSATALSEDPRVRVLLVTGAGDRFCAGGDVKQVAERDPAELPLYLKTLASHTHVAIARLASAPFPVVAAVQGAAAGAGFCLACSCDLVIAASSASFVLAYGALGLTPDASATWLLPRLIGLRRAFDLAYTNRSLSASEALEWGLISRVVPDGDLEDEAEQLAATLAAGPTRALAGVKRLLRESFDTPLETQMEREVSLLAATARSADAVEGVQAAVTRRPARFTGG